MKPRYLFLLFIPCTIFARIGETEVQCVERYGSFEPAFEQKDTRLFQKAGLQITVHYFDGKADVVIYSKVKEDVLGRSEEFSSTEIDVLLKSNAGEKAWLVQRADPFQKFWVTEDGALIASYRNTKSRALIILTKESANRKKLETEAHEKSQLEGL